MIRHGELQIFQTETTNLMNIFVSAIIAVCICALTVWLNIQIKFAESKGQVMETYKKIFFRLWVAGTLLYNGFDFFKEAFSNDPLTRKSVVSMILSASVFLVYFSVLICGWIVKLIE
jgi:hypothetical protein